MSLTPTQIEALRARYRAGEGLTSLSRSVGLSRTMVARCLKAAGEMLRPPSQPSALPPDPSWWTEQFDHGRTVTSLSTTLHVSTMAIYRHLSRIEAPKPTAFAGFEHWLVRHSERIGDCLLWRGARNSTFHPDHAQPGPPTTANRLVWEHHRGPIPDNTYIVRTAQCPHPTCIEISHLRALTRDQHMTERGDTRQLPWGEGHWHAKLTEGQARQIHTDQSTPAHDLAARYQVSESTINAIRAGRAWRHLHDPDTTTSPTEPTR